MFRAVVEEAAALTSLALFVAMLGAIAATLVGYVRARDDVLAFLGVVGLSLLTGFVVKNLTDDFLFRSNAKEFWALLAILVGIVFVEQGQRRIPVQYAKRMVGRRMYGGASTHIPLKVNTGGVMPVIFASAILLFPQQIFSWVGAHFQLKFLTEFSNELLRGNFWYYFLNTILILFFSYFWVATQFNESAAGFGKRGQPGSQALRPGGAGGFVGPVVVTGF